MSVRFFCANSILDIQPPIAQVKQSQKVEASSQLIVWDPQRFLQVLLREIATQMKVGQRKDQMDLQPGKNHYAVANLLIDCTVGAKSKLMRRKILEKHKGIKINCCHIVNQQVHQHHNQRRYLIVKVASHINKHLANRKQEHKRDHYRTCHCDL